MNDMQISSAKKAKLRAVFNPDFHPRYPAGHPLGGQFMKKGGEDYKAAIKSGEGVRNEFKKHLDFAVDKHRSGNTRGVIKHLLDVYNDSDLLRSKYPTFQDFSGDIHAKINKIIYGSDDPRGNENKSLVERGLVVSRITRSKITSKLAAQKKLLESGKALSTIFPKLIVDKSFTSIREETLVGDHKVSINIDKHRRTSLASTKTSDIANPSKRSFAEALPINIQVNDRYDKIKTDDRTARKIALKARSMINAAIKDIPDGTIVKNAPYESDGFGEDRARLYKAAGFSDDMHAMIIGGKFKPITLKELSALKSYNHVAN